MKNISLNRAIRFSTQAGLMAAIGMGLVSCGGGDSAGSSKPISKGQKVNLSDAELKVISSNVSAGKVGAQGVSQKLNGGAQPLTRNSETRGGGLFSALTGLDRLSTSSSSSSSSSGSSFAIRNGEFKGEISQACDDGGNVKMSGQVSANGTQDKLDFGFSFSADLADCQTSEGLVNGKFTVGLNLNATAKSAELTTTLSGATKSTFADVVSAPTAGQNAATALVVLAQPSTTPTVPTTATPAAKSSEHSFEARNLSITLRLDEGDLKALNSSSSSSSTALSSSSKAEKQKAAQIIADKTECTGSLVIDGKAYDCADLLMGALEQEVNSSSPSL